MPRYWIRITLLISPLELLPNSICYRVIDSCWRCITVISAWQVLRDFLVFMCALEVGERDCFLNGIQRKVKFWAYFFFPFSFLSVFKVINFFIYLSFKQFGILTCQHSLSDIHKFGDVKSVILEQIPRNNSLTSR